MKKLTWAAWSAQIPRPPDSGKPLHIFFERALIYSKLENLSCRIVDHDHWMDSRIVIESDSRPASFAPGSTAEAHRCASEAGAKGLIIVINFWSARVLCSPVRK